MDVPEHVLIEEGLGLPLRASEKLALCVPEHVLIEEGLGHPPHHFDPQMLATFKKTSSQFEEIYERLKG